MLERVLVTRSLLQFNTITVLSLAESSVHFVCTVAPLKDQKKNQKKKISGVKYKIQHVVHRSAKCTVEYCTKHEDLHYSVIIGTLCNARKLSHSLYCGWFSHPCFLNRQLVVHSDLCFVGDFGTHMFYIGKAGHSKLTPFTTGRKRVHVWKWNRHGQRYRQRSWQTQRQISSSCTLSSSVPEVNNAFKGCILIILCVFRLTLHIAAYLYSPVHIDWKCSVISCMSAKVVRITIRNTHTVQISIFIWLCFLYLSIYKVGPLLWPYQTIQLLEQYIHFHSDTDKNKEKNSFTKNIMDGFITQMHTEGKL